MPDSGSPSDKSVSIITAVGREEPDYLRYAGNSLVALAKALPDWKIKWFLAVDGINPQWVHAAVTDLDISKQVVNDGATNIGRGPAFPRNRALKKISSEWLLNLDADDEYIPNAMAELLTTAHKENAAWVAGKYVAIDSKGNVIARCPDVFFQDIVPVGGIKHHKIQYRRFPFHCSAAVVRTSIVKDLGGWVEDPALQKFEDTAMWTKVNEQYAGRLLSNPVFRYRKHQTSFTHQPYWARLSNRYDLLIDEYLQA